MITLSSNETALLLAIKGHNLEILPKVKYESYTGYIMRVAGLSPGCELYESSFYHWVLKLYDTITEGKEYKKLLGEILNLSSSIIYYNKPIDYIISAIRLCQVKDKLILDKSIKIKKEQ